MVGMACTYNSDHHQIGPRISFSNDFVRESSSSSSFSGTKHERPQAAADPSVPDFEFTAAGNHSMIAADELFFKGRLMPLKEDCATRMQRMTLRDELRNDEEGWDRAPPSRSSSSKVPMRWKELLGLRKSPPLPKKRDKSDDAEDEIHAINKPYQDSRSEGRAGR